MQAQFGRELLMLGQFPASTSGQRQALFERQLAEA
ncbi:hypothetical protein BJ994_000305 [Arthrobacter pigmenti]|uniref:Uncharacterized protein n=1 Tax=Arthrobacter pigmenti TaxID=271432 RepID=A0A846RJ82_9MICC|nr:hypothetical protein [Arthrobacter pigmenti]